ncbi:MAG: HAMP domain-containing histidine kinase [Deltaproteobacteria bacterium]|jgi:signal transduction histidine kinase|nr:HAMP domain-containing histidine kinase [Deltaproteobacteria bacterium]
MTVKNSQTRSKIGFFQTFFDPGLDLRVRLFNILGVSGMVVSLITGTISIVTSAGMLSVASNYSLTFFAYIVIRYSRATGRHLGCYYITIVTVFFIFFPILFLGAGGFKSGMPCFFVFAVVFTVFMLEGAAAVVLPAAELILYSGLCLAAYLRPGVIRFYFDNELDLVTDVVSAFVLVSVILGVCVVLHMRLYTRQKRELDERNEILAQASMAKTQFLSNASHDMRTPLTVISVNVQTVMETLRKIDVGDQEAHELLQNSQNEIMRLARMVRGMLTLASMSENTEKKIVDLSLMLRSGAETLRLNFRKNENELEIDVADNLTIFGNADLMAQVTTNILQNANNHTMGGRISVGARREGGRVLVELADTGSGIDPELLPHVFKRGVSDKGTGLGLSLCKTVVESHGGMIWIASRLGEGTTVSFTLPQHESQLGGV